ncbi:hypothetical protein GCM10012280_50320 [Wenjunlia tyrosinilytica]|uniref:non-specific serine/threonine protein kinase n=1 Tax=Wenjunlia tyrosinilytica TaxID=1544741 RepID=A0A917ZVW9_9ACTN|nr:hypothetical protein GCM10012280_50320 [Wenjunlia tyrosinilytica]
MREGSPLTAEQLQDLAKALAKALIDIHRTGVVHRDLKPTHVLLTADGPCVIDFGIARAMDGNPLARAGQAVGTPPFMAPEQFTARTRPDPTPTSSPRLRTGLRRHRTQPLRRGQPPRHRLPGRPRTPEPGRTAHPLALPW